MYLCLVPSKMHNTQAVFHIVKMLYNCRFLYLYYFSYLLVPIVYQFKNRLHTHYMHILWKLKNKRLRTNQKNYLFFRSPAPYTCHIIILLLFLEKIRYLTSSAISIFVITAFSILRVYSGRLSQFN